MKHVNRFAIGICFGAIAAFLYLAVQSARSVTSLAETETDQATASGNSEAARASLSFVALRAEVEPATALREALAIDSDVIRTNALKGVARVWARQNPEAALEAANNLPADSRSEYVSAAMAEWAFVDPDGFFVHAESAASIDELIAGLEVLIATDPERVFQIVTRFNGPAMPDVQALYLHAVRGMAGRDPLRTFARLQPVAEGAQRDRILTSIAEAYADIDANAALAWAMSVTPLSTDALGKVIESVAAGDLLGAYDMLQLVPGSSVSAESLGTQLVDAALRNGQSPATLASAFAARAEPGATAMLTRLMQQWAQQDPHSAVAWMPENEAYLTDELTRAMVFNIAFEDVSLAAELAARVPASARDQWLAEVAGRYGQFDIETGMSWLMQFSGSPAYDQLLNRMLIGAARTSPQIVANYIETSGAPIDRNLIAQTAFAFAQQDPEVAIQWALRLDDPEYSAWALEGAVDRWTQTDGPAASRWVLSQPRGAARDRMLDTMLLSSVINPTVDIEGLLDAYDSSANAQRTLAGFILRSTRLPSNLLGAALTRAETLAERLTDPVLRQQAEDQIAEAR